MLEEFENRGFTQKTQQLFSVHTMTEEFKNKTNNGHLGFVFEENVVWEITSLLWSKILEKTPFHSHRNKKLHCQTPPI